MNILDLIHELRISELESLRSEFEQGRERHILKTLDERGRASELLRQQYSGRYAFELLQNANDAMANTPGSAGAARFVLTEQALLVADQGGGFGPEEVRAICGLGRSSKDPRKSIGYKGLGFKSVGEITDRPQIVSQQVRFGFDERRARGAVEEVVGHLDPHQRIPVYAFPFELEPEDLGGDGEAVDSLVAGGFTSILRLPFRHDVTREKVAREVQQCVTPRLLLFLDATTRLSVTGGEGDFDAESIREEKDFRTELLLEADGQAEHWLVYEELLSVPDQALVEPLGDAWASVEQVRLAAAVDLDDKGRPVGGRNEPLHVYFPTQEASGLPLVLHADFALDLDRRRISQAPEAQPYNQWLRQKLGEFVGRMVAPDIASRDAGDGLSVAAFAPIGSPVGFGEEVHAACLAQLASSRFVPALDETIRQPTEVLLLPSSLPDAVVACEFLDVAELGGLIPPQAQNHAAIRALLRKGLGVAELDLKEALDRLAEPDPADDRSFYEFLVEWADVSGRRTFVESLREVPCVRTAAGDWTQPSRELFFPRRDDTTFPQVLHVPVAAIPDVEGLRELLRDVGVRDFEWRELLTGFVLPLLTDEQTDPARRNAAMVALRTYYTTALRDEGAQAVREQAAGVLLPARRADGSGRTHRPARELYFPSVWTGSDPLEAIYGSFGQPDFLADDPPESVDEREVEAAFLHWLGVEDKPRVLVASPSNSNEYKVPNLGQHPHARHTPHWDAWLQRDDVQDAKRCDQGHSQSQQLYHSTILDRLGELIDAEDPSRLAMLWMELVESWSHYRPALTATFRCVATQHAGERNRRVPSLLGHLLKTAAWVPCRDSDQLVLEVPQRVWRPTRDTPRKVLGRIPRIEPSLDVPDSVPMTNWLGVIDAARPTAQDLVRLLESLAASDSDEGSGVPDDDVCDAARWLMRALNDVLQEPDAPSTISCPLLARHQGTAAFDPAPYIAEDPLLEETFEPLVVVLDADRNLRALHRACGLRHLDEEVTRRPIAAAESDNALQRVRQDLDDAMPYLAAVAIDAQPSRENDVYRGLSRLELVVCEDLTVIYELEDQERERRDAAAFIAERVEQGGRTRRRIGTVYLELDATTGLPHWFAFGPQLATFLNIPGQGDAFGLLLAANRQDRERYLAARRIAREDVELARLGLDMPPAEEEAYPDEKAFDELVHPILDMTNDWKDHTRFEDDAGETVQAGSNLEEPADRGRPYATDEEPPPLPPLDLDGIVLVDADDIQRGEEQPSHQWRSHGNGLGPTGAVDPATVDRIQRSIGRRGEEAAFAVEQRRLRDLGFHPDAVRWVSNHHQYAVYDFESVDERGNRIYIEVKATTDSDPCAPFLISENELTWALSKRGAAYVYRVTDSHTPKPRITRYRDPIGLLLDRKAQLNLGQARMAFQFQGRVEGEDAVD